MDSIPTLTKVILSNSSSTQLNTQPTPKLHQLMQLTTTIIRVITTLCFIIIMDSKSSASVKTE